MKLAVPIVIVFTIVMIWVVACEQHQDPFSALNKLPTIVQFSFAGDSLKYKKVTQGIEPFRLNLKYADDENQKLTATFKFLNGHGIIFHSSFNKRSETNNTVVFDAPSRFDSSLSFIPDTTGLVEIELELSDQVKISKSIAATFFFANTRPVARFTYSLEGVASPYRLVVDASESYDPDSRFGSENKIVEYRWSFGDQSGWISTAARTFPYTYVRSGNYTVQLKVIDNDGGVDSTSRVVSTNNQAPVAMLQVDPVKGEAPLTIRYTATNSLDPDGKIVAYRIDFDDGSSSVDSAGTHLYTVDKDYRVRLKVQDNLGQTDTAGVNVKVSTAPVAIFKVTPVTGPFPLACTLNGKDSYDPQGGKLKHDIYINGELKYANIDSVVHTFDAPEKYIVSLVVTSLRNNLTDDARQTVDVINLNPRADFIWQPEHPQHRTVVTYTSTSTDSNQTDKISYYKWTFPDGTTEEGDNKNVVNHTYDAGFSNYSVTLEVWDRYRGTKFEGYDSITKIVK
ncbi:MAG: PKD domain-containing protein [candidate division KSB1 bacterium]|nr:PKD domain-containing protein [candidate division KSB1 bacterium]